MDRNIEPPAGRSPQSQERWVKIAFYVGLLLLVGWLYFSSAGGGGPAVKAPGDQSRPSSNPPVAKKLPPESERPSPRDESRRVSSRRSPDSSTADDESDAKESRSKPKGNRDTERDDGLIVRNVRVPNEDGRIVYRGDVDLQPTLDRIERGKRLWFSHDGIVFENRERRLPSKPAGYYREFVQPTPNDNGPGGQRLVIGRDGEVYYSPDHYKTFRRVR